MDREGAVRLVEGIRQSLRDDPGQFHIAVNVTGQSISVQGGGTGLVISARGGGPGSTTVGQHVSLDGSQVEIGRQKGRQAMDQQLAALLGTLDAFVAELRSSRPDGSRLSSLAASLTNTWVPGVITSVLGNIITMLVL